MVLLRSLCLALSILASSLAMAEQTEAVADADDTESLVIDRIKRERAVRDNPSVLLAHKRNYILPLTWANQPNDDVFEVDSGDFDVSFDNIEVQFQFSLKVPLTEGLVTEQGTLYTGITVRSFWQAYNGDISAPFRETSYEPELFWVTPVPWKIFGGDASLLALGVSHQSNGRSQLFSRSWNRIYANLIWERNRFVFSFKPWWRIPESKKDDPLDADGDDNPDIEDFLGNFELAAAYRKNGHEVSVMLRNNLDSDDNRGAIQLDWTFPMNGRLRGYAQFFNGYGESLIDYDAHIERLGVGILLTDLL